MNEEPPAPARRRVFLVDDHPLVREGLTQLINQEKDLCVCAEAEGAAEAYAGIVRTRPDAVVVDLTLQGDSGFELIKRLQAIQPHPPSVLVLSMHDEDFYAERALRAGALGYVMKRETSGNIIAALRKVLNGQLYVSAAIEKQAADRFLRKGSGGAGSPVNSLTDRELDVFRRIGQGQENRRIAEDLNLSLKTVQTHCANIKGKLGFENATVLMREAVRWVENQP
jgi:DNA-binding NarL/FixJ family response regulator